MTTTPPAPTIDQLTDDLERAVFQRRTPEATKLLIELLKAITGARTPTGVLPPGSTAEQRRAVYTRVAAMISALVCSPDFQLDMGQIDYLSSLKPVLEAIFELSGYGGPAHLLQFHGKPNPDGTRSLNGVQVFVLSMFFSLDGLPNELLQGVLMLPPDQLLPLYAGWFASPFVHHAQGERNRAVLIENSEKIEAAQPSAAGIGAVNSAWMHCSYAAHPDKHRVKRSLNQIWLRLAKGSGLKSNPKERKIVERPTLLIAAERMLSGHAMQRSYEAAIAPLRSRYRVVCMASQGYISADTHHLFDEVVILEPGISLKEIGSRVVRQAPDLIYYPSLGMSEWTQMIANLRFAPIQLMTLGHPAPPMCDTMDYALVSPGVGEVCWEYGRKVVELRATPRFEPHQDILNHQVSGTKFDDGRVHLAVNSSLMKLSPRFLALCERIEAEATRPVHFHFFASAGGVMYDRLHQVFERRFRHFTLEPSRTYGEFLKVLERCHVALAAFPFGNTNSTVDTCMVHVPTVAFRGNEPLSIFDRDVLRMAGMPDWLACPDDESYFQTAMRLIHDESARAELVDMLRQSDLRHRMFEWQQPGDETAFVDAMDWIYKNHEALQASSAHVLRAGEPIPA
jgi:hypothetical protein